MLNETRNKRKRKIFLIVGQILEQREGNEAFGDNLKFRDVLSRLDTLSGDGTASKLSDPPFKWNLL